MKAKKLGSHVKNYDPVVCNNEAKRIALHEPMLNLHNIDYLEIKIVEATRDTV